MSVAGTPCRVAGLIRWWSRARCARRPVHPPAGAGAGVAPAGNRHVDRRGRAEAVEAPESGRRAVGGDGTRTERQDVGEDIDGPGSGGTVDEEDLPPKPHPAARDDEPVDLLRLNPAVSASDRVMSPNCQVAIAAARAHRSTFPPPQP